MATFMKRVMILIGFLLLGSPAFPQQDQQPTIERVDIRGNRRIPEETIRANIAPN